MNVTKVYRAWALDTSRHLSIGGRYPRFLALPDEWVSWWLGGVIQGLKLIRQYKPAAIWSTYPIATAHLIGLTLQRFANIPWIADLRDPMIEDGYPIEPKQRKSYRWIEARIVRQASKIVFVAPGTQKMYRDRYPHIADDKFELIENGYDETAFAGMENTRPAPIDGRKIKLVHSGIVYPAERDPTALFDALTNLKAIGEINSDNFHLEMRACGHEDELKPMVVDRRIEDIVTFSAAIPYRDALREMMSSDGLLVLQGSNCNNQIPAKAYEYIRAGRPILALTDPDSDTARLLRQAGTSYVAGLEEKSNIMALLRRFIIDIRAERWIKSPSEFVANLERGKRAIQLVESLDALRRSDFNRTQDAQA